MSKGWMYTKMAVAGAILCIGGPALIVYVTPSEEELFKRYNPELQRRSLANRVERQQDFDNFVGKLKEYSKSNRPIWEVAAEDEARTRRLAVEEDRNNVMEMERRREEIRRHSLGGS